MLTWSGLSYQVYTHIYILSVDIVTLQPPTPLSRLHLLRLLHLPQLAPSSFASSAPTLLVPRKSNGPLNAILLTLKPSFPPFLPYFLFCFDSITFLVFIITIHTSFSSTCFTSPSILSTFRPSPHFCSTKIAIHNLQQHPPRTQTSMYNLSVRQTDTP